MRTYNYIGLFRSAEGNEYTLKVNCVGYLQAFILLTADAIRSGRHYQLKTITHENGDVRYIDDIHEITALIS